jgi:hypothetical protein
LASKINREFMAGRSNSGLLRGGERSSQLLNLTIYAAVIGWFKASASTEVGVHSTASKCTGRTVDGCTQSPYYRLIATEGACILISYSLRFKI